MTIAPATPYGVMPAYFSVTGRTLSADAPATLFDAYCAGSRETWIAIPVDLATHVAGMIDDPPPLTGNIEFECVIATDGTGSANGGAGPGGCG